jgi:hypothetical protein
MINTIVYLEKIHNSVELIENLLRQERITTATIGEQYSLQINSEVVGALHLCNYHADQSFAV